MIGIAVGGCLAVLFCGMSLVFMTIKRKKRGKHNPETSKVENYKSAPKTGMLENNPYIEFKDLLMVLMI